MPGEHIEIIKPSNGSGHKLIADLTESPLPILEIEANARLMAAAPDLLEALEIIVAGRIGTHGTLCSLEQLQEIARAAIAKAGGAR